MLQRATGGGGQIQLIVATQVTANDSDQGQMLPVLEQAKTNVGENPETVLADAGYSNERDLQALESAGVDGYVALGRESKQQLAEVRSEPARERMRQKLSTEQSRNQYARAQMAVGSAQRLDQAGAWISTVPDFLTSTN